MEGMDDGAESETVKQKREGPRPPSKVTEIDHGLPTKVTEIDHGLPIDRCDVLELQAKLASLESEWPEELSSLRSFFGTNKMGLLPGFPVVFGGILEAKKQILDRSKDGTRSHSWSTSGQDCSMSNTEMMVEELTLKNYNSTNVSSSDGGFNTKPVGACHIGQAQSRRIHWEHLYQKVGQGNTSHGQLICKQQPAIDLNVNLSSKQGDDVSDKEKLRNVSFSEFREQTTVSAQHPVEKCDMAAGNIVHSDRYHNLRSPSPMPKLGGGLRTRIPSPSSGFSEFFANSTFKGKGIAFRDAAPVKGSSAAVKHAIARNAVLYANIKPDLMQTSFAFAGGSFEDGVNLRELLRPGSQKLNKSERFLILRQILELVDLAHSLGVFIKDLRPSSFIISNNQVRYVGSSAFHIPSDYSGSNNDYMNSSSGGSLKRKWHQHGFSSFHGTGLKHASQSVDVLHSDGTPPMMHQKFGDALGLSDQHSMSSPCGFKPESMTDRATTSSLASHSQCGTRIHENEFEVHEALRRCTHLGLSSRSQQQFSLNDKQLEERWYVSPEEINGKACSLSSNIYNLGVLLFELFCCSESWEAHASSMSDLSHRILPPNFLAENPKEAGFCLWLVHPEPSSRPKAR